MYFHIYLFLITLSFFVPLDFPMSPLIDANRDPDFTPRVLVVGCFFLTSGCFLPRRCFWTNFHEPSSLIIPYLSLLLVLLLTSTTPIASHVFPCFITSF